jgi:hypothetical protein
MRTSILIVAAATLCAVPLRGQAPVRVHLIASVPFPFHQGDKLMPAGRYEVKPGPGGSLMTVNLETETMAISVFNKRYTSYSSRSHLRFSCYGASNRCFLREVAVGGSNAGLTLPSGRIEGEYHRATGAPRTALVGAEGIQLAAR